MKKLQPTKLQLRTETIKTLDVKQLQAVAGGGWNVTITNCYRLSCGCG